MMNEQMQQMDYNMLLMNHLNRLSFVTTSSFIDVVSKESIDSDSPLRIGETALDWGVHFLYCMIPDDLLDAEFKKAREAYLKDDNDKVAKDFVKLKAIVNLLNRKGLLLSKQMPGRMKKQSTDEDWPDGR